MPKWGSCDIDKLQGLFDRMEKLANLDIDQFCIDASREMAARLLALVIPRTPVGRKPTLKRLGGEGASKTVKVKGTSGRSHTMLSREGAILAEHWEGYIGGTLRRGWTAKSEAEAQQGGSGVSPSAYASSMPVTKTNGVYQITVINPINYTSYVEYGHRQTPGRYVPAIGKRLKRGWVPGQYMLTISERQLSEIAPAILERKLNMLLKEALNG